MIITCPNCKKQFKIDNSLITHKGRNLQCGSCDHVWFYKSEEKNNELLKSDDDNLSKDIEIAAKQDEEKIEDKVENMRRDEREKLEFMKKRRKKEKKIDRENRRS